MFLRTVDARTVVTPCNPICCTNSCSIHAGTVADNNNQRTCPCHTLNLSAIRMAGRNDASVQMTWHSSNTICSMASAWASRYAAVRTSVSLAAGVAAFCTFLFIQMLGLPLPLTGPWLSLEHGSPLASAMASVELPAISGPAPSQ